MAERPTPHSVAVCTLIALYSDPSSLIHRQQITRHHASPGQEDANGNNNGGTTHNKERVSSTKRPPTKMASNSPSSTIRTPNNNASTNSTRGKRSIPSLQEHLSKVIKHVVITNGDGWSSESNGSHTIGNGANTMWNYRVDAKTMSLSTLLDMISDSSNSSSNNSNLIKPFQQTAQFLLDDLAQSCLSIDSLVDLFSALRSTVAKGIVDGDSAHGIYVRKRCLGFDELSFESVGRFWESFCVYVGDASLWGATATVNANGNGRSSSPIKNRGRIRRRSSGGALNSNLEDDSNMNIQSFPSDEMGDDLQPIPPSLLSSSSSSSQSLSSSKNYQQTDVPSTTSTSSTDQSSDKWPLAPRQISRKLLQQCLVLHRQIGQVSYTRMEAQIQSILDENPELILAHFLRFLNCALHGERVGALEHFHRYFDYAMIQERKDRSLWGTTNIPSGGGAGGGGVGGGSNQSPSVGGSLHKNVVQYAAILLASLFHGFANDGLAHLATEEAVRVAQQSGDGSCLAFALGWLHATTDGGNGGTTADGRGPGFGRKGAGAEMLVRAGSRAAANNLRTLVAGASLLRANYFASASPSSSTFSRTGTGDGYGGLRGVPPVRIWESVAAASTDGGGGLAGSNINGNAIGSAPISHDTPTLMTNLEDAGDAMEIFAQQHLVSAGLWHSIGHNSMASTTAHLTMRCYRHYLSSEQYAYLVRNVACSVLYGTGCEQKFFIEPKLSNEMQSQSLSCSLQRLGINTFDSTDETDRYTSSPSTKLQNRKTVFPVMATTTTPVLYQTALEKLHELQSSHHPNVLNANSKHSVLCLMNECSIRRFDLHAAISLNSLVYSFSPLASQDGILSTIEAMGQHSLLLCRKRNWDAAKHLILNRICPLCERNGFRAHRAHFLLQAALIELESKTDDPVCALHLILECLVLCAGQSMDSMHATALSLLARLHLKLNNRGRAKAVLKAAMPTVLQHGHVCFHGEAWLTMAKCSLGDAKDSGSYSRRPIPTSSPNGRRAQVYNNKNRRKLRLLKASLLELSKAEIAFVRVQDVVRLREVFYLQAQICNSMKGRQSKRNEAARKFQEMNCRMVQSVLPVWHDAIASVVGGSIV